MVVESIGVFMETVILRQDLANNYILGILKTKLNAFVGIPSINGVTVASSALGPNWGVEVTSLSAGEQALLTADYKYQRLNAVSLLDAKKTAHIAKVAIELPNFPASVTEDMRPAVTPIDF